MGYKNLKFPEGSTFLVTGGAGFIGTNFIYYLVSKYPEYKIICIDKLTYAGTTSTLRPLFKNPNFKFYKADICSKSLIEKIFSSNFI